MNSKSVAIAAAAVLVALAIDGVVGVSGWLSKF